MPQMESVGSNFPSPAEARLALAARYNPSRPIADRILRALGHRLRLLHRSGPTFFVLGATGNVYTVTVATAPSCTCPDRTVPCKHILFVLLRVLRLPLHDVSLHRRALRSNHVARLLAIPTAPDSLAGPRVRERFLQLHSEPGGFEGSGERGRVVEEGALCPVCLEEMSYASNGEDGGLMTCGTCGNSLHEECLEKWRKSRGRRAASCVVCRARWRERREQEKYVNLAAYAGEDDDVAMGDRVSCSRIRE